MANRGASFPQNRHKTCHLVSEQLNSTSPVMTEPIEIQTSNRLPAIKLQFDRREDRWEHCLILATEDSDLAIMSSLEGTPDQILPPSAPLQDVSRHSLEPKGDAVLCVGMAGKNHWSASFSIEPDVPAGLIKSDLACLQKTIVPNASLGSTYAVDSRCEIQSCSETRVELLLHQKVIVIEALSGNEFETIVELNDRVLSIRPGQISNSPVVATRWGFVVAIN